MLYDNEPESLSVECQLVRELDVLQHSFSSLRLEKKKKDQEERISYDHYMS